MTTVSRRQLLGTTTALLAGTALGSPASANRGGDGRVQASKPQAAVPDWADWVPTVDTAPAGAAGSVWRYEMDAVLSLQAKETPDRAADSLVLNPLAVSGYTPLLWAPLESTGLDQYVLGPATDEGDADPADVPAERGLAVGETQVYLGSFDDGAITSAVEGGAFSETATTGVYAHDEVDVVVRWDADAVVVGSAADAVDAVFETGRGRLDRRHAVDGDFAWVLQTGGDGDLTVANVATSGTVDLSGEGELFADYSMFEGSTGYAQSATVQDGAVASATAAVLYADEESVKRDRLESHLGVAATDRTVDQQGRKVTVEASYGGGDNVDEDTPTSGVTSPGLGVGAAVAGLLGGAYHYARRGDDGR